MGSGPIPDQREWPLTLVVPGEALVPALVVACLHRTFGQSRSPAPLRSRLCLNGTAVPPPLPVGGQRPSGSLSARSCIRGGMSVETELRTVRCGGCVRRVMRCLVAVFVVPPGSPVRAAVGMLAMQGARALSVALQLLLVALGLVYALRAAQGVPLAECAVA